MNKLIRILITPTTNHNLFKSIHLKSRRKYYFYFYLLTITFTFTFYYYYYYYHYITFFFLHSICFYYLMLDVCSFTTSGEVLVTHKSQILNFIENSRKRDYIICMYVCILSFDLAYT